MEITFKLVDLEIFPEGGNKINLIISPGKT